MKRAIFFGAMAWQVAAWSGGIDKVTMAVAAPIGTRSVTAFAPVHLRINGGWSESTGANAVLKILDVATLATLAQYNDFVVQNLAVDELNHFTIEVSFRYGSVGQTNFVFGNLDTASGGLGVTVRAYAEKNPQQEASRILIKNLENSVNHPNFEAAAAQVQMDDYARVEVVVPVLRVWLTSTTLASKEQP
jgi:hypothetical protein